MSFEFKLPDLGEGIHEAEILAVKVAEGQAVKEDQPIFEVETDKAVVEIPSPVAGIVENIHVKSGEIVKVGRVMITFTTTASAAAKPKDAVKAPVAATATPTKTATKIEGNGGQVASQSATASSISTISSGPIPAAPATRRMAREMGVDLKLVRSSGPGGRVLKEDVRAYAEGVVGSAISGTSARTQGATQAAPTRESREPAEPFVASPLVAQPVELPDFSKYGQIERVPLRSLRRKIAINMAQSWAHVPRVTTCDEADITQLDEFLKKNESNIAERKARMTLTVFMAKALVSGLKKFPQFNSSLDESTSEIIYKRYYNVGIAVATDRGLIVPVIHNADQKTLNQIAIELGDISRKTREGKIELDQLQGGTFTLTNVGAIGGTGMVPMVNYPEAAILGMARAQQKPVVHKGKIDIGTILPLSLSFDHRIVDGAEAAYFLRHIANCLEEPLHLLLEE